MATSAEDLRKLREMLGEPIPVGGSADDTFFSDYQLETLIEASRGNLEQAAYEGWRNKTAMFVNLVNVSEGAASRELSSLHKQALEMVKLYARASSGPTEGRARIGRITRR